MPQSKTLKFRNLSSEKIWEYENGFYWFSHPSRLNKLLAHYELFKTITKLPGEILELGVYKSASLVRWATFRNALENDFSRKIIGFDAFGAFPNEKLTLDSDFEFINRFERDGGAGLDIEQVREMFQLKKFENVELVKGNVFDTIPQYLARNPATRIALLHLDMDVKEPTEFALERLYERVVPNGLIVFDDYNSVAGETDAVDEFLKRHCLSIEKLNFYSVPSFVRKPISR